MDTKVLISNNSQIEADWKYFHTIIKVPAEFKVDERTQCSRDVFKELTQLTLEAKSGQMVTGGTKLHDQKDTNLCAYFATMSALRHQLRKIVESEISGIAAWKINSNEMSEIPQEYQDDVAKSCVRLKIEESFERKDHGKERFKRDLAVMIGCVCPRALSASFRMRSVP